MLGGHFAKNQFSVYQKEHLYLVGSDNGRNLARGMDAKERRALYRECRSISSPEGKEGKEDAGGWSGKGKTVGGSFKEEVSHAGLGGRVRLSRMPGSVIASAYSNDADLGRQIRLPGDSD